MATKPLIYQFDDVKVEATSFRAFKADEPVPMEPKAFEVLVFLIERRGRLVTKDELFDAVWKDTSVTPSALTRVVAQLRHALGDDAKAARYIETVPTRGYRFVAAVSEAGGKDAGPAAEAGSGADSKAEEERVTGSAISDAGTGRVTEVETPAEAPLPAGRIKRPASLILIACVIAAGLGVGAYLWLRGGEKQAEAPSPTISIAVLPFKLLVADARDESLELGMADTLITRLSSLRNIVVRPTSTVRKYSDLEQDPVAAGRELGVEAVLEGSIQRLDGRLRVTARLVSVRDGTSLWADKYDETFTDILKVEDSISEKVARALRLELTGEEKSLLSKHYTEDSEAHQLYMMGRYHWSRANPEGWGKAVEHFTRSIEKDPDYALAYTGLADAYVSLAFDVLPQAEAVSKAKASAQKALELDATLAEAHVSLGRIKAYYEWAWSDAEEEFERAIELNPNSANAYQEYGLYLACLGRSTGAIRVTKQARGLDPFSLSTNFAVGWALIGARRYDEVIEVFRKTLEIDPKFAAAHQFIGMAYGGQGMWDEAIRELRQSTSLSGDSVLSVAQLGHAYASSGKRGEAEKILAGLLGASKQRRVSPYYVAIVYAGLGDKDQAFAWLEKAYGERSRRLWALKVVPTWDSLRSDPRFADLLRRMYLPQ